MTRIDLAEFVSDYLAIAPGAPNKEIAAAYAERTFDDHKASEISDDEFDTVVKNVLPTIAYYTERDE